MFVSPTLFPWGQNTIQRDGTRYMVNNRKSLPEEGFNRTNLNNTFNNSWEPLLLFGGKKTSSGTGNNKSKGLGGSNKPDTSADKALTEGHEGGLDPKEVVDRLVIDRKTGEVKIQ